MNRHEDITLLGSKTLLAGRIFDVVHEQLRLPSGLEQDLLVVDHPGAVCVAPVLPSGELLLVRQYRHAAGAWLIELPAGRLEADEVPLGAAQRELEEETGHRAGTWAPLSTFLAAPGFCSELITMFTATDLTVVAGGGLDADADEEIELVRMTPHDVLRGGRVIDGKTLLAAALLSLPVAD